MGGQQVGFRVVALNCRYTHSCLALFYLRSVFERHLPEVSVDLLQLTINDPYYQTLLRIADNGPDVLFFSAYIWNRQYLRRLLGDLARLRPGRPMVIGGPHAAFLGMLPKECTLVLGEIEGVDPCFYRDLEREKLQPLYSGKSGAEFGFPYRRQDFSTHLQNRQVLYESSRGCPFSCSYCLSAASNRMVRKDLPVVEQELLQILQAGPPLVKFIDRTFNDHPERALAIWRFLSGISKETRFHFEVAPDRFTSEMLDYLATIRPGLFQFEIGVQSTSAKTLAAVNRRMDVSRALRAIERLSAQDNIHIHVDLILGLPGDTVRSFADSFRHVFSCRPHYIQMGLLKVLPGTPIIDDVAGYDLLYCSEPPFEILSTNTMNQEELSQLYLFGECVERFYNNRYFPSLYAYLHQLKEDPFVFFVNLLTVCRERDFFRRAATQELMTDLLLELIAGRSDEGLMRELLIYDWLRCGHRYIPPSLASDSIGDLRARLRRVMPGHLEPLYTGPQRNRFLKQGIFHSFSPEALQVVGAQVETVSAIVCFTSEKDNGLRGLRRTMVVPWESGEIS